ncbi:hypothetical protein [Streptomyces swartbergensis]|uniref:hypothetical protein n=1 Tax=Streptomyces swartbergensis TaxID=487165 RepID=UPI000A3AFBB9|nr:hypothetical protein [Streptomyces swartbergensis]
MKKNNQQRSTTKLRIARFAVCGATLLIGAAASPPAHAQGVDLSSLPVVGGLLGGGGGGAEDAAENASEAVSG